MVTRRLFFVFIIFLCLFVSCSKESSLLFTCGENEIPIIALNNNAKNAFIKKPESSSYAYFSFPEEYIFQIQNKANELGIVSFKVLLKVANPESLTDKLGQFAFGFLYPNDFKSKGKLNKSLDERPIVTGEINSDSNIFSVAMTVPAESVSSLKGFFVYSTVPLLVENASMVLGQLGFDISSSVPEYFLPQEGGNISLGNLQSVTDFSNAGYLFFDEIKTKGRRPIISIKLQPLEKTYSSPKEQQRLSINIGKEEIFIRRVQNHNNYSLHCCALETPFAPVVSDNVGKEIVAITMKYQDSSLDSQGRVLAPLNTDPGMIPLWSQSSWRNKEYELFQWEQFPGILFFDTANYKIQDDFFKRLAFFTEKTGYVGTLASDSEIKNQHGFNAHDYRAETLADFFTLALKTNFPLNEKEKLLCDILVYNKIILPVIQDNEIVAYSPGYGAIISISQESAMYLRYTFVVHEGFHGLYFVDSAFRDEVAKIYNSSDKDSIQFLLRYFQIQASLNYNIEDTYLIQNEFMAYMMQQSVVRTGSYFADNLAQRGSMLRGEPILSAYVTETKGQGFMEASQRISDYVFKRWGMEAGRIALVTR